jgi:hypothetical protein
MDGTLTRTFLKCRLFRKHAAHFSDRIHVEDAFDGAGANFGWTVKHSKTSDKQKMRERQYVETYKKLLEEGKITAETMQACLNLHYYIKE